jgi:LysR family transcriptional regulator, regulator of abg operon
MMKLHQLSALVTAIETGSLRQAAEKMRLSQPALSRSIRELENEVGVKLIERTTRGVEATVYGKALVMRSKIVDAELRHARDDIAHLLAATHGDLQIGVTPVSAFSLLPRMLSQFRKGRSRLRVGVTEGMGAGLINQLRQGDFDFVLGRMYDSIDPREFNFEILFSDSLVAFARKGHPLARVGRLTKAQRENCEWILPGLDSPARTAFQRAYHDRTGAMPQSTIESNSFMTMLTILSQTDLVGISPQQIFRGTWLQKEFAVIDIGLDFPSQPTGIIRRARGIPSAAAQFAIKELRSVAQRMRNEIHQHHS